MNLGALRIELDLGGRDLLAQLRPLAIETFTLAPQRPQALVGGRQLRLGLHPRALGRRRRRGEVADLLVERLHAQLQLGVGFHPRRERGAKLREAFDRSRVRVGGFIVGGPGGREALGVVIVFPRQPLDLRDRPILTTTVAERVELGLHRRQLLLDRHEGPGRRIGLGPVGRRALEQAVALATSVLGLGLQQPHPVVGVVDLLLQLRQLGLDFGERQPAGHDLSIARVDRRAQIVDGEGEIVAPSPEHGPGGDELEKLVAGDPQLEVAQLVAVATVALGLLGLAAQGGDPAFELGDDVADAHQVLTRRLDLALRRGLLRLEAGDPGGLVDDVTTLLGLARDDLADLALLDARVALGAGPGAHQQLGDVAQAGRNLVDQVLGRAVGEQPPRDRDLRHVERGRRGPGLVVEDEGDLGHARRAARGATGEAHVGHARAAQVLGTLLPHRPAHGVDDVRLAAAVGADHPGHVVVDHDHLTIRERLEAEDLDLLEPHLADTTNAEKGADAAARSPSARESSIAPLWRGKKARTRPRAVMRRRSTPWPSSTISIAAAANVRPRKPWHVRRLLQRIHTRA